MNLQLIYILRKAHGAWVLIRLKLILLYGGITVFTDNFLVFITMYLSVGVWCDNFGQKLQN